MMVSAAAGMPRRPSLVDDLALVHHAVLGEDGVLEVMHDQRAEILGIGERAAHHRALVRLRLPSVKATRRPRSAGRSRSSPRRAGPWSSRPWEGR